MKAFTASQYRTKKMPSIKMRATAGFDGQAARRDYYFKTRNAAREFRLRIKRWKAEQKYPADTLSFDDSDKIRLPSFTGLTRPPESSYT
jgi:hypothetical protein